MLKTNTKRLLSIAKRERPKAVEYYTQVKGMKKPAARKTVADNLRSNRKLYGGTEARRLVLKGHGYKA